ncbi:MAG: transcription elongation factor GreA [Desulfobacterota bacterium]|nr:transcription elongation factor GreA [Thermodesulfobacteriota bacterium]MDW8001137.1 transcription elongation factor GreA [Deltaproteobacteria bacterium]
MKIPITKEGYEKLKRERDYLISKKRPEILKAIEEARAHGDLSENAEYDAAKEEYQLLQKKIAEIEEMLEKSTVMEPNSNSSECAFGSKVKLKNVDTGDIVIYQLVGPFESDVKSGRISVTSPLGKALLGRRVGEEVRFSAPGGEKIYEVLEIE